MTGKSLRLGTPFGLARRNSCPQLLQNFTVPDAFEDKLLKSMEAGMRQAGVPDSFPFEGHPSLFLQGSGATCDLHAIWVRTDESLKSTELKKA